MVRLLMMTMVLSGLSLGAAAQTSDSGFGPMASPSIAAVTRAMHAAIRRNLAEAADAMPAGDYDFKPTPDVRTFAQIIGHVATANFMFCSQAKGEASPAAGNYERTATDKTALVKALTESLAYCDEVYGATTDANFNQVIKTPTPGGPRDASRGGVLTFNTAHNNEHYGNLTVYLRLKGHVPPSTGRVQSGRR
jgi:uncharacterized damage-inducible protein DinB